MISAIIEEKLSGLRQHPQTLRLWNRNLRFRTLLRRWESLHALAASRTMSPGILALRGRQLEAVWAEVEGFFARFEDLRKRLAELRERVADASLARPETTPPALEEIASRLGQQWNKLEIEPFYTGDLGLFADLEAGLAAAERKAEWISKRTAESELAKDSHPDARERHRTDAVRLVGEINLLMKKLKLSREGRTAVTRDKRRIIEALDDGDSSCAFWWAKDLHSWLQGVSEKSDRAAGTNSSFASVCEQNHQRFQAVHTALTKLLRTA